MSDLAVALLSAVTGGGLSLAGAVVLGNRQRRHETRREQLALLDRYLHAGVAAHHAVTILQEALDARVAARQEAALVSASAADVELRVAALALYTRSGEGDVLSSQAVEAANVLSSMVAQARGLDRQSEPVDRVVRELHCREIGDQFVAAFSRSFSTARMIISESSEPWLPNDALPPTPGDDD